MRTFCAALFFTLASLACHHRHADDNTCHEVLSANGFEHLHTGGQQGIHIHAWHSMRYHHGLRRHTTIRYR